jgi:hypothetical protein
MASGRSSLGFNADFQLTQSSTRLNSCTSSQNTPNCTTTIRTALAWSVNKAHTRSCSMLRHPTSDATTLRCIVSNRCSRNCSTLNLKIEFRKAYSLGGSLHCNFGVIPGLPVLCLRGRIGSQGAGVETGQNSAPWRWRMKGSRKWLPDIGASISLALDER